MKIFNHSKLFLGLLLSAYACASPVFGYPAFVTEWASEIRNVAQAKGLVIVTNQKLEDLLLNSVNLDNFDVSCSALLQSIIKETSVDTESNFLNLDSALDICTLINPWNSMECSGVTGVTASYARSIQEFVKAKDNKRGDLRAACIIATAISPGRPFAPLERGSIKAKCENVCSGSLSKTISVIDPAFCSLSVDLCGAVDFTTYNAFTSLSERELGMAVAVSVLLSEGSLGLRTSFREGCRFVLAQKQANSLPQVPSDVSEPAILSAITEFYKAKLTDSGLLPAEGSSTSETVFLKVLVSQISKAMKTILEASITKKQPSVKPKKSVLASTHITSSEVSPLSDDSDESLSPEYKTSSKSISGEAPSTDSPVPESWFYTLKQSIKRGTKDIDAEFDDALNIVVSRIDSSSVYSSCVAELKKLNLASHRRAVEACRKIDPFSHAKCQKLNHFELIFLIKLREQLEKYGNTIIDLRDLCSVSSKMSMESFLRTKNEELSNMCIKALQKKGFKGKYYISDRAIKKACIKADYFRTSSCGNIVSGQFHERVNIVFSLATGLFDQRSDKERLQTVRESESNTPSYVDLCNAVEKLPMETVEDCVFEMRDSLFKFSTIRSMINIEDACIFSMETVHGFYGPEYAQPSHSIYSRYPPFVERRGLRRFYKDIEHAPFVTSLPWVRRDLPTSFQSPRGFVEQEYSESRKGFYRGQDNKTVYHDGNRYKIGGLWYIKVGDDWYIDESTALDFVKIIPSDPRYNPYPLSQYTRPSDPKGVYKRKSFATYLSPYTPRYPPTSPFYPQAYPSYPPVRPDHHQYHYLQDMYGRHASPAYQKCPDCFNWIPYGHSHKHFEPKEPKEVPKHSISIQDAPEYDPTTGLYVTRSRYFDANGILQGETRTSSYYPDQSVRPGTRDVGIQTPQKSEKPEDTDDASGSQ
ncbi:hypothetical protein OJ253_2737 [Cryptosporidium canis]|uniref:Signal peptide-containing protein n=1 Tax=Cryptosporidium canis TaxID=195482 RepID=A0A9D5DFD0_9CRYT|nr:hypothetical protein OJ253_2737 [Cryptosporidium canis]